MKDRYHPFDIGKRFSVVPAAEFPVANNRIKLVMDRGAFGSGEHETTQSCLEILENLPLQEAQKSLDLGSGTAILTIAKQLLHPGQAWCIDIEESAIISGRRNCRLNKVDNDITHVCGTLEQLEETNFNLILANIYGDILLDVAGQLVNKAETGALLLLSGILWEYNFDVRQKYQKLGCKLIKNCLLSEYSTILMQKT
ncbi:[LSU ribosomal protein L11P]-lysine N-methyltransferase [Desulfuromusa kysingii]|uniref:[LSU ribosomal protein L11P]-lysine N-methyltransferase n=1 Tax=Desulfuromusa kysingii TaxID=37625 RepID=A0A1H4C2M6_9BACT|nr:50S ribosomal protein L11 methyltransferase [Desulfuromusa kysingii]SEA54636.1 [LSU ribosomal protein L11P]-lysine N-methyltransferase [Desulfuromusa kysingii]